MRFDPWVSGTGPARLKPAGTSESEAPRGLLAAVGALADFDELDEMIEEIYIQREHVKDRAVTLDE